MVRRIWWWLCVYWGVMSLQWLWTFWGTENWLKHWSIEKFWCRRVFICSSLRGSLVYWVLGWHWFLLSSALHQFREIPVLTHWLRPEVLEQSLKEFREFSSFIKGFRSMYQNVVKITWLSFKILICLISL